jgi:hypothetical protein
LHIHLCHQGATHPGKHFLGHAVPEIGAFAVIGEFGRALKDVGDGA